MDLGPLGTIPLLRADGEVLFESSVICEYLDETAPPQNRLEQLPGGKLSYLLKKPWRDGTVALVLEPLDLIARVCALIPPPRFHMVRITGC